MCSTNRNLEKLHEGIKKRTGWLMTTTLVWSRNQHWNPTDNSKPWSDVTVSTQKSETETYPELQIWSDSTKVQYFSWDSEVRSSVWMKPRSWNWENLSRSKTHLDSPLEKPYKQQQTVFSNAVSIKKSEKMASTCVVQDEIIDPAFCFVCLFALFTVMKKQIF